MDNKKHLTYIGALAGIIILLFGLYFIAKAPSTKKISPYTTFAECITASGAKFYGAFWCPHCQAQKAMFKDGVKSLPYVECSNPDRSQNDTCKSQNIEGYPTWILADGSRVEGTIPLIKLAELTKCPVVQ